MRDSFRDNAVIITGASSGIGRELALQLADQGARLALAARSADALEAVADECRARGARAAGLPTDVADPAQCRALIDRAIAEFGRLDTLINNAGISVVAKFADLPDLALFEGVMRVNFMGAVACTHCALPHLKAAQGRIVVVNSLSGRFATPRSSAYCASKHALTGFFDALRSELHKSGVSVTVIYPSYVVTPFAENLLEADGTRRGAAGRAVYTSRMMSAARCARIILRAAARRRREKVLTLEGQTAVLARVIAPNLLDRIVRKRMAKWKTPEGRPS